MNIHTHHLKNNPEFISGLVDRKEGLDFLPLTTSEEWKIGWTTGCFGWGAQSKDIPGHVFFRTPLASTVLVVASLDLQSRQWAAYILDVPGENHALEAPRVVKGGTKLTKMIASLLFPEVNKYMIWRD